MLLVEKGLVESREKAQNLIRAGQVRINGAVEDKPSKKFTEDVKIEILQLPKYVSRGAYKLLKAFEIFELDVKDKVCCDIGSSTGGFTQVLLEKGAKKVYAVDVGRGQLHWKLRNDPRVIVMEKTNARYLKWQDLGEKVDFFTCDVSFISVLKILDAISDILIEEGEGVILVKPQFEASRRKVVKGIVKDPKVWKEVIDKIREGFLEKGFSILGLTYSPIKGNEGNVEFLMYVKFDGNRRYNINVDKVIEEALKYFYMEE